MDYKFLQVSGLVYSDFWKWRERNYNIEVGGCLKFPDTIFCLVNKVAKIHIKGNNIYFYSQLSKDSTNKTSNTTINQKWTSRSMR